MSKKVIRKRMPILPREQNCVGVLHVTKFPKSSIHNKNVSGTNIQIVENFVS